MDHRRACGLPIVRAFDLVWALGVALALVLAGCAPAPSRIGARAQWTPSPSFNERRPNIVVLHHTSNDTVRDALRTLTDPAREVSAHYLVGRDGSLHQLVDERHRAWHAGDSRWGAISDLNSVSIGIELDNNGREPFPRAQTDALLTLLAELKTRYSIPRANFIGHADVAPGRKVDPSSHFPWRMLAERGYGLWCAAPLPAAPPGLDFALGLRALGYNTANLEASIRAFKLHFIQDDDSARITQREQDMLHCLLEQRATSLE